MRVDQGPLERGGEDERRARETARRLLGRDNPGSARQERSPRLGFRPRFQEDEADDGSEDAADPSAEEVGRPERFRRPNRVDRADRPVPVWRRPERQRRRRDEADSAAAEFTAADEFAAAETAEAAEAATTDVSAIAEVTDVATTADRSRAGRIRGVVRKVDTWSVFKVSLVFYAAMYCIVLVAGIVLWLAATATGLRHNVESFIADLIASGKFHFVGTELLRAAAVAGVVLVVLGTAANVLLVVLYNLISDMVGGVNIVIEDRPARHRRPRLRPEPRTRPELRTRPEPRTRPESAPEPVDEPVEEPVEEVDELEVFKPRPSEANQ